MHRQRKVICYLAVPLGVALMPIEGSDINICFGENGKKRFGGHQLIIRSMHRWRKVICYIMMPLGWPTCLSKESRIILVKIEEKKN